MRRDRAQVGGGAAAPGHDAGQEIWLLGQLTVFRDGAPLAGHGIGSRKARTLLGRLAVDRDRVLGTGALAEALWPDHPPAHPERQLATLVSRLRASLGREIVVRVGDGYRFGTHAYAVDVDRVSALVIEAERRLGAAEPGLALAAAGSALELLERGELVADEPEADWLTAARQATGELLRRTRLTAAGAALAVDDLDLAVSLAGAAAAADPLDERACRMLMRAHHRRGEPAAALGAYQRLRSVLADELGVDPAERTRELHLAILRDRAAPASTKADAVVAGRPAVVGRAAELAWLRQAWSRATDRHPGLVLLVGEAGVGKTTLAMEAVRLVETTGGRVARARCYEAERSLFLQPVAEALRSVVVSSHPDLVRKVAGPTAGDLAALVAEVGEVLRPPEQPRADPDVERRRVFETVASFLRTLAARQPVLLFLDDLHLAGSSTLELLHFLARRLSGARVLLLATVRIEESGEVRDLLGGMAEVCELGPLPEDAVGELARRAGLSHLAGQIMQRTRGHSLYVVETLRALAEAPEDSSQVVPESLRAVVTARVRRAGPAVEQLLQAAATLGAGIEPTLVAELTGSPVEETVRAVSAAAQARLVTEAGATYEFANDLIREIAYQNTPLPIRIARHRLAARLLADQPEAVAGHAGRAGDWPAAVEAYLRAAEAAERRYANREAEHLLERAMEAAVRADDPAGLARARLARGRVREGLADFQGAYEDHSVVVELARGHGRTDLELAALNQLGGDLLVGLGRSTQECVPYLEAALTLAARAADVPAQVDILGRLAVIWTHRLRFDKAQTLVDRATALARRAGDQTVDALALDARKTTLAYRGEIEELAAILPRLHRSLTGYQPGLRRYRQAQLRVWASFEATFPAMARGRWPDAVAGIGRALEIARESGYVAYQPPLLAHLAWVERARGRYGEALRAGQRAVALAADNGHPWWIALAGAMHGWTLTELGAADRAIEWLEPSLAAAEGDGTEGYVIRCLGHLAWAVAEIGGSERVGQLAGRVETMLAAVRGGPFGHGGHAGLATASGLLAADLPERAQRALVANHAATGSGWVEFQAWEGLLAARCAALGPVPVAGPDGSGSPLLPVAATGPVDAAGRVAPADQAGSALATASRAGLPGLVWQAHALLAELAPASPEAAAHRRAGTEIVERLAASIDDADIRQGFLRRALTRLSGSG